MGGGLAAGLELARLTTAPPGGACPFSMTMPPTVVPPLWRGGRPVSSFSDAGPTVKVWAVDAEPIVAVIVTAVGAVTWPMLRRAGYPPEQAGGMLAAAGVGAILSPPTLGAAAFIVAEYLNVSYLTVLGWAMIPTVLYYLGILLAVEIDVRRFAVRALDAPDTSAWRLLLRSGYHFSSLIVIVVQRRRQASGNVRSKSGTSHSSGAPIHAHCPESVQPWPARQSLALSHGRGVTIWHHARALAGTSASTSESASGARRIAAIVATAAGRDTRLAVALPGPISQTDVGLGLDR